VRTRLKYLFAIPYGGMSGENPGESSELPVEIYWPTFPKLVKWMLDHINDHENRVKKLEDEVARLKGEEKA
jgi:hypothetical protein